MDEYLGIDRRLKDGSPILKLAANDRGIRQIPVVGERQRPARIVDAQRLRIRGEAEPRRRIADVTDRDLCIVKLRKMRAEHLADEPHALFDVNPIPVRQSDARTFLSSVLERKKTEIRHLGDRFRPGIDAVDAALFLPLWLF